MRLTYNILWIENEQDWLDATVVFVKDVIEENGFTFKYVPKSSEKEIEEMLLHPEPFKDFDLILVDFNLDKGDQGNKIIENIRNHNIFTEVIFYSQDADATRQAIKDHWLDGIYCSSRNRNDFEFKFEKVFLTTVRKIQHISSMRGLVLSETSQLDNIIEDILHDFLSKRPQGEQEKLKKYIIDECIKNSFASNGKLIEKLNDTIDNVDLIGHVLFDADKKRRSTGKIIELIGNKKIVDNKVFLSEYKEEVIDMRNNLAHAVEIEKDGAKLLKTRKSGEKLFDDKECTVIRKNLKKHFAYLEAIKASI